MAKELNNLVIADAQRRFKSMTGCVLIDYAGIDSEQTGDLRATLKKSGVSMSVIHNRLARLAFADRDDVPAEFAALFRGPTAIVFHEEDGALTASKTIANWRKENAELAEIKGGLYEGQVLTADGVNTLAKIPDRETLQAQICTLMGSPLQVLVGAAKSVTEHMAGCVKARHEELGGGES